MPDSRFCDCAQHQAGSGTDGGTFGGVPSVIVADHRARHSSRHHATNGIIGTVVGGAISFIIGLGFNPPPLLARDGAEYKPNSSADGSPFSAMPAAIVANDSACDPTEGGTGQ